MINLRAKGGNGRCTHRAVLCGQALSVGQTRSTLSGGLSGWKGVRPTDTGNFCRSGESDGLFKSLSFKFCSARIVFGVIAGCLANESGETDRKQTQKGRIKILNRKIETGSKKLF